jgi:hypothetical protein
LFHCSIVACQRITVENRRFRSLRIC